MTTTVATHSLAPLLSGYISGTVSDEAMSRFDDLFVDTAATPSQREAFAQFYLDALAFGDAAEAFPTAEDATGILSVIQA